jgi:O-antigen ligase
MVIRKTSLINALFVLSFPFFGIGCWISPKFRFSAGIIFGVIPFALIILVHLIGLIYQRRTVLGTNRVYLIGVMFSFSLVAALLIGLRNHMPGMNPLNTFTQCIQFVLPFTACVIVQLVNRDNERYDFARLLFTSLTLLLAINYLGVAAGMRNLVHSFPDRIAMPFINGIYDSGHVLCLVNLMLLSYLRDPLQNPVRFMAATGFFLVNLAAILDINSRLSTLIFLPLLALFVFRLARAMRGLYTISLFTMPLMMSFSLLIYTILSQPFFVALLERVDKEDITTFNGRTYIWGSVADWAFSGGKGLLFGLGYHGQYSLRLFEHVAEMWGEEHSYNIHAHSTFLEILLGQGIFGMVLMYLCMWYAFKFYRQRYVEGALEAPIFAPLVYILFIWQIDMFCYGTGIGHPIFFAMLSMAAVDPAVITRSRLALDGRLLT